MTTIFIISAPSGSGKSTLVNKVRDRVSNLEFSISYTTRKPRGAEQDGKEYSFVTREQFEGMIRNDEFLEHACVFGDYYGTARRFLRNAETDAKDLLLDIDVQGAAQIKSKLAGAVSIFILPPTPVELERRLRERGQDSEEKIQHRLKAARREIENYQKYDYILVNDRLDESVEGLEAILLSERLKRSQQPDARINTKAEMYRLEKVSERLQPILRSFREDAARGGQ